MQMRGWAAVLSVLGLVFTLAGAYAQPEQRKEKGFVFFNGMEIDDEAAAVITSTIEEELHEDVLLVEFSAVGAIDVEQHLFTARVRLDVVLRHRSVARIFGQATVEGWTGESPTAEQKEDTIRAAMHDAVTHAIEVLNDLPLKPPAPEIRAVTLVVGEYQLVITDDDVASRIKLGAFLQNCDLMGIMVIDGLTLMGRDAWDAEHDCYTTEALAIIEADGCMGRGVDHIVYEMREEPAGDAKAHAIEIVQLEALRLAVTDFLEQKRKKEETAADEGK